MTLLLYFLAAFGLAYIVGHSAISLPVRTFLAGPRDKPRRVLSTLVELIECPACFGTWTGIAAGGLVPSLFLQFVNGNSTVLYFDGRWYVAALIGGCATAGVNLLLATWVGMIDGPENPEETHMKRMLMHMVQMQLSQMQQHNHTEQMVFDPNAVLHEQPPEDTFTEHDERQMELLREADGSDLNLGLQHGRELFNKLDSLDSSDPLAATEEKA